jgi:hypothetical protein
MTSARLSPDIDGGAQLRTRSPDGGASGLARLRGGVLGQRLTGANRVRGAHNPAALRLHGITSNAVRSPGISGLAGGVDHEAADNGWEYTWVRGQ